MYMCLCMSLLLFIYVLIRIWFTFSASLVRKSYRLGAGCKNRTACMSRTGLKTNMWACVCVCAVMRQGANLGTHTPVNVSPVSNV